MGALRRPGGTPHPWLTLSVDCEVPGDRAWRGLEWGPLSPSAQGASPNPDLSWPVPKGGTTLPIPVLDTPCRRGPSDLGLSGRESAGGAASDVKRLQ